VVNAYLSGVRHPVGHALWLMAAPGTAIGPAAATIFVGQSALM
jgi:hypothetical protein